MATYVISDLHGEYERLDQLLTEIEFSEKDDLYIIGDVVDRGQEGIRILREVMQHSNMHMLLGNHELMMIRYFADDVTEKEKRRWNRNRNFYTLAGLDQLPEDEREKLFTFLNGLPDHAAFTVNGKKYVLVHGYWADNTFDRVWNRPTLETPPAFGTDVTMIIGHTPVCEYVCPGNDEDQYVYSRKLTEAGDHFRILHTASFIDIDCCVGYGMSAARLACLRLDDGKEFYV